MNRPVLVQLAPIFPPMQQQADAAYEIVRLWTMPPEAQRDAIAAVADRCDAILTTGGHGAQAALMRQLPGLRIVSCFGVGVDAIDLEYCRARGVAVTNTPDVLTEDVADLALALLLAAVRRVPQGDRFVREGRWLAGGFGVTATLQRRRVGIVGLGRIGQSIARRCAAFGCEIGYFGPRRKPDQPHAYFDDVVALAAWADVLVAACPGGAETLRIVSRPALEALGPESFFVNIARGSVVDQAALVELLVAGRLAGAGLDVFDDEPHVPQALIDCDRAVLQPHQGSATVDTRLAMGRLALDNLAAHFAGRALPTPVRAG